MQIYVMTVRRTVSAGDNGYTRRFSVDEREKQMTSAR